MEQKNAVAFTLLTATRGVQQDLASNCCRKCLPKLQLSWKDRTNGPPPYAGMQLMV